MTDKQRVALDALREAFGSRGEGAAAMLEADGIEGNAAELMRVVVGLACLGFSGDDWTVGVRTFSRLWHLPNGVFKENLWGTETRLMPLMAPVPSMDDAMEPITAIPVNSLVRLRVGGSYITIGLRRS